MSEPLSKRLSNASKSLQEMKRLYGDRTEFYSDVIVYVKALEEEADATNYWCLKHAKYFVDCSCPEEIR